MFKQYMYSKHTIDVIILQNQRPVAVHNTDFTSTKQFNLQNKEQTQRRQNICNLQVRN